MDISQLSITELKATAFYLQYSLNQVMNELQKRNPAPQVKEVES